MKIIKLDLGLGILIGLSAGCTSVNDTPCCPCSYIRKYSEPIQDVTPFIQAAQEGSANSAYALFVHFERLREWDKASQWHLEAIKLWHPTAMEQSFYDQQGKQVASTYSEYFIPDAELLPLLKLAEEGDTKAAELINNYKRFVGGSKHIDEIQEKRRIILEEYQEILIFP